MLGTRGCKRLSIHEQRLMPETMGLKLGRKNGLCVFRKEWKTGDVQTNEIATQSDSQVIA